MQHVALALDGRYLRLGPRDARLLPRLCVGPATLGPDAVFERVELGHGRIALRTTDGDYLAVEPDPGLSYAVYAQDELTPEAAFEEILWPNGQVSLRSCHLTYVGADGGGQVSVNRTHAGLLDRFFLVAAPVPTVPAQRDQSSAPRATSASPSSSACRSDRMISGTA